MFDIDKSLNNMPSQTAAKLMIMNLSPGRWREPAAAEVRSACSFSLQAYISVGYTHLESTYHETHHGARDDDEGEPKAGRGQGVGRQP